MKLNGLPLPVIACNGYIFIPRKPVSETSYSISSPMEEDKCVVSTFKNNGRDGNPQEIDPGRRGLQIGRELEIMSMTEERSASSKVGVLVSIVVSAYLWGIKKNHKLGAGAIVLIGAFAVSAWYFNRQCRRASFDAANKVLTARQN